MKSKTQFSKSNYNNRPKSTNYMKAELLEYCKEKVTQSMQEIKGNLDRLQADANNNSKSSMGDKYETGRAMIHLEQENLASSFHSLEMQLKVLSEISIQSSKAVTLGSIVKTDSTTYFISIGLGKIEFDGQLIYAIAANSPIGQALIGKQSGDIVSVMKNRFTIQSIT